MSTQITVRLPDGVVAYIDRLVAEGEVASRAAAVSAAILREQRRRRAEQDAYIYATQGEDPELVGLAEWQAANIDLSHLE